MKRDVRSRLKQAKKEKFAETYYWFINEENMTPGKKASKLSHFIDNEKALARRRQHPKDCGKRCAGKKGRCGKKREIQDVAVVVHLECPDSISCRSINSSVTKNIFGKKASIKYVEFANFLHEYYNDIDDIDIDDTDIYTDIDY